MGTPHGVTENQIFNNVIYSFCFCRCLLILDDIWSPKVARVFDVQCRVLVTTRDKSVADAVGSKTII